MQGERTKVGEVIHDEVQQRLERAFKRAQIFALIVMPVVLAVVGWVTQRSLAEGGLRKDYVQMAVQVLHEPRRPDDAEIRAWARAVINKHSPIPLSPVAGDQLSRSVLGMVSSNPLLKGAMSERPSCPEVSLQGLSDEQQASVLALRQLCARNLADLRWMQVYIGLLTRSEGPASAPR